MSQACQADNTAGPQPPPPPRRLAREQLDIHSDDPAIQRTVRSAEARLDQAPLLGPWHVIGALAAGARKRPADWLHHHATPRLSEIAEAAANGRATPPDAAATLLAAARNHAWTGVAGFTSANRHLLRDAALALASIVPIGTEMRVLTAALRETADAIQDAGDSAGAAAVIGALRNAPAEASAVAAAAGAPAVHGSADSLIIAAPEPGTATIESIRKWWSEAISGDTERAGSGLRETARRWPDEDALAAAFFLAALVHGFLGVTPDAARHRVRLAPLLPDSWPSLTIRTLRVGDATVDMTVERWSSRQSRDKPSGAGSAGMAYDLVQDSGAVPIRVVLEARASRAPDIVRLDGRVSQLDVRPVATGGFVVPVQFELDQARRIELLWT